MPFHYVIGALSLDKVKKEILLPASSLRQKVFAELIQ
jgi:hypothetical protein